MCDVNISALISGPSHYTPDTALDESSACCPPSPDVRTAICARLGVPKPAICLSNAWCAGDEEKANGGSWIQVCYMYCASI